MKKIIITGGHLTPALAVIEELKKKKEWQIYYLGRKFSLEGKKVLSRESEIIPKTGVVFVPVISGRLQRKFTLHTLPSLLRIPAAFFQSWYLVRKIRPDLVVSFGSYVSTPVVIAAWLLGIPIVSHEQTVIQGLANKINARFSKVIAVSHKESLNFFPKNKAIFTGNPIRSQFFNPQISDFSKGPEKVCKDLNLPLIYITGGNQGAQIINRTIWESLPVLLKKYVLVHQTGRLDYSKGIKRYCQLETNLKKRYFVKDFLSSEEVAWVLNRANLVISRAGANITYELGVLGKTAILIPLPISGGGEQEKNADFLKNLGQAEVLAQENLSSSKVVSLVNEIFSHYSQYQYKITENSEFFPVDGASRLVKVIYDLLQEKIKLKI